MTYSQPRGYRIPSIASLPALSRKLELLGWPTWRAEVVTTVASLCHEIILTEDAAGVFARHSRDQVGLEDLPLTAGEEGNLVLQVAEFIDVAHGLMAMPSARPLSPAVDLRCRAQFMDDPADLGGPWIYVLFGTQRASLERAFLDMDGVDAYPVEPLGDDDAADLERAEVWDRVLVPYARFTPLSVSAPEPQVLFDIAESWGQGPEADEALAAQGKVTISGVVDAYLRLGGAGRDQVYDRLTGRAAG